METLINLLSVVGCCTAIVVMFGTVRKSFLEKDVFHKAFQWGFWICLILNFLNTIKFMMHGQTANNQLIWIVGILYYLHKKYEVKKDVA